MCLLWCPFDKSFIPSCNTNRKVIPCHFTHIISYHQIYYSLDVHGNFLSIQALYPYTTEIYETKYRAKAMAVGSLSGRFGVILLGMIGVHAINWFNGNGLYILFVVASGLCSIAAATMPYCTLNKLI